MTFEKKLETPVAPRQTETQRQVEAIQNGTVIDHIPANIGFKILKLFQLDKAGARITMGLNLPSTALGKKDLIKIEEIYFTQAQVQQLAFYAPQATVNNIEHYQVVNKLEVTVPDFAQALFDCPNSNCITNFEPAAETYFTVLKDNQQVHLRCRYCEKVFARDIVTERSVRTTR